MSAVWITGAGGFVGGWLLARLAAEGRAAAALVPPEERARVASVPAVDLRLEEAALAEPGADVADLDALPEPEGLIHLAALSFPPACEADPSLARAVNVAGPARLYESVLARWPDTPIVHVSTGQVYEAGPEPLAEDDVPEPGNVYGATKLQGEAVAFGLRDRGHRVTVARPFNHTGAGQAPAFALPSFAMRIAALERDGGGTLEVGRLDAVRDFLHVDQVVGIYLALLERAGEADVVNVCSGVGHTIGSLLEGLVARASTEVEVRQAKDRLRGAADPSVLVGDPSRLRRVLGNVPELDREALLDELSADARARVAAGESLANA